MKLNTYHYYIHTTRFNQNPIEYSNTNNLCKLLEASDYVSCNGQFIKCRDNLKGLITKSLQYVLITKQYPDNSPEIKIVIR